MKLVKNTTDGAKHFWSRATGRHLTLKPGESKEFTDSDLELFENLLSEDKELEVLERMTDLPIEKPKLEFKPKAMPKAKTEELKDLSEIVVPAPVEMQKMDETKE